MALTLTYAFLTALAAVVLLTPLVIALAHRRGWAAAPREDRWHKKPTAVFGGAAIYLAFAIAFLLDLPHPRSHWVLFICASLMFLAGLWDDAVEMRPQVKFLLQLILAIVAVSLGVGLDREVIPWPWLSIPLAVFWLVGVTNAVNILDNMDGLSSGVVFIAATTLALGSVLHRFGPVGPMSAALAGAALGFLIYNFNPAKIFMGDCGSMFMGFTLAGLTILSANTAAGASSLALSLLIPVGALVVPIFDTALVTFQRTSHGRSIAQGGRDHSSHRLVFLGLSERKAVLLLLGISLLGALVSLALARLASPLTAAVLAALVVVALVFFGIYLGDVKVYDSKARAGRRYQNTVLGGIIMHKKQILQIVVDTVLLAAAYTAAWLLRFEGDLSAQGELLLAQSLPWLLAAKLVSFWAFGLYRGDWRYVSVHDIVQILKGCLTGSLVTLLMIVILYRFQWYSRAVLIIDFFLAFMFIAGARSLIRIFREKVNVQKGVPVLIVGAGDGGELLLRELRNNSALPYTAVGFIDDDPAKRGQVIHGVKVLGSRKDLAELIAGHGVRRVFISILSAPGKGFQDVFRACRDLGVDCTRVQPMIKIQ